MERTTIIICTLAEKMRAASLWRANESLRANAAAPQVLVVTAQAAAGSQADQQHARRRLTLDAGRQRSARCHRHHGTGPHRGRLPALRRPDRVLRQPATGVQARGPEAARVLQGHWGNCLPFWSHAHHAYFHA